MRQGPLAGRYPAVAAMVLFALIPYLALSAALQPLTPIIARDLHTSLQTLSLGSGLANAAYAVGTVLAVQFAQHLPQRRMLVLYAALLLLGSVLAASAQDAGMYIAGHVLQGLCTSLLLIAAVPPLAIGYPGGEAARHRGDHEHVHLRRGRARSDDRRAAGERAAAGVRSSGSSRRSPLRRSILSLLTFDDAPPADPDSPRDLRAIALAAAGCVAAFLGASQLLTHRFVEPVTLGRWRRPRADRDPDRLPVPREATAADDPHDADEHDAGRGHRGRAVRGRGLGVGHGAHLGRPAPAPQPAPRGASLPARRSAARC